MVAAFAKFESQQQLIDSLPDYIKEILFPDTDFEVIKVQLQKSSDLYQQLEDNGGVTLISNELKDFNKNFKEGKSLREEMENSLDDLKTIVNDVERKTNESLNDVRTLSSIFGIPTTHNFSSPPPIEQVKEAKSKFDKASWNSISQLFQPSSHDEKDKNNNETNNSDKNETNNNNSTSSSHKSKKEIDGLKHTVMTGLKNYILADIVEKEILPLKTETSDMKTNLIKLENATRIQLQQELDTLKNELVSQDARMREKFHQVENQKGSNNNSSSNFDPAENRRSLGDGVSEDDFNLLAQNVQKITVEQASAIANVSILQSFYIYIVKYPLLKVYTYTNLFNSITNTYSYI